MDAEAGSDALELRTWVVDLDGVVWRGEEPIEGSAEALATLREAGVRVLFLTNNSRPTLEETVTKLQGFGIEAAPEDLVTSAQAAARLVERGATAMVCGGPGVTEALKARDVTTVDAGDVPLDSEDPFDAVVVGFHRDFDYDRLTVAFRAIHRGARLIGTNDDPTYPTPQGLVPGGGSILAAVATAAGVEAQVAGKPNEAIGEELADRLGGEAGEGTVLVGDRPSTDGLMARRLGLPFYLVLTGVTSSGDDDDSGDDVPEGDVVAEDLATLVADVLGRGRRGDGQESA